MNERWYSGGLRFECQRCGTCCTGDPGFVFLRKGEAETIASFLGVDEETFLQSYTREVEGCTSLKEEADGRCVFYTRTGCRIYAARPGQCRTFPFWLWNVVRESRWGSISRKCPGIGRGRNYSPEEIEKLLALRI